MNKMHTSIQQAFNRKEMPSHFDVIIIGGGVTGAGTARDCAMRGLSVLLIEKGDYANGATGRNHGLLHSGARYAVTDQESASECIKENMILRKIARHCVEETDGLFITLPGEDLGYQSIFADACARAGIRAEIIDPKEAIFLEPAVNPAIIGAVKVPDASIDPFRLTAANIRDAIHCGAMTATYHEVIDIIVTNARVEGVKVRNNITGETFSIYASVVINAAGIWGTLIARKAGVEIKMLPAKGSLLIYGHRVNNMVLNRCRKPADADILVPDDAVCVIGTTSLHVPIETIDKMRATPEEVDLLMREGEKLAPALATTRILRSYAGVRPLVASDDDPTGRTVSRGIVCLDHATRDGLEGFITITGGKMMTYRLMAEQATDLACKKLGNTSPCLTAIQPLTGSAPHETETSHSISFASRAAAGRHGTESEVIADQTAEDRRLICECEGVTVGEIRYAVENLYVNNLDDLRRRTRVGMGTCQSQLCAIRAAKVMCELKKDTSLGELLSQFVCERWKGIAPIAWGDTLREAQLTQMLYGQYLREKGGKA